MSQLVLGVYASRGNMFPPVALIVCFILSALVLVLGMPAIAHAEPLQSEDATLTSSFHQGFTVNTNKCAACHSTHQAAGEGVHLLKELASLSCAYCHIDTTMANTNLQVYGGKLENYTSEPTTGSAHWMSGTPETPGPTTCVDCHSVHASPSGGLGENPYTSVFRLQQVTSADKGFDEYQVNPVLSTDSTETALSKWCIKCHPVSEHTAIHAIPQPGSLEEDGGIDQCMTCHAAEYGTSEWPHYSPDSEAFLLSAESMSTESTGAASIREDGVCLICHRLAPDSDISRSPKDDQ